MYASSLGSQFKYILVAVDGFTRYGRSTRQRAIAGMVRPMAAIKAASAKKALQSMMQQAPFEFRAIYTDRGWHEWHNFIIRLRIS